MKIEMTEKACLEDFNVKFNEIIHELFKLIFTVEKKFMCKLVIQNGVDPEGKLGWHLNMHLSMQIDKDVRDKIMFNLEKLDDCLEDSSSFIECKKIFDNTQRVNSIEYRIFPVSQ